MFVVFKLHLELFVKRCVYEDRKKFVFKNELLDATLSAYESISHEAILKLIFVDSRLLQVMNHEQDSQLYQ